MDYLHVPATRWLTRFDPSNSEREKERDALQTLSLRPTDPSKVHIYARRVEFEIEHTHTTLSSRRRKFGSLLFREESESLDWLRVEETRREKGV
jgi:hypothetical protein